MSLLLVPAVLAAAFVLPIAMARLESSLDRQHHSAPSRRPARER